MGEIVAEDLTKVLIGSDFGPQIIVVLIGGDLAVNEIAHTGKCNQEEEFLHALTIQPRVGPSLGVGPDGLEPSTSSLSGKRSNQAELWARNSRQSLQVFAEDHFNSPSDPDCEVIQDCEHSSKG